MIQRKEFPMLFKKTSTGAIQGWAISVQEIDGLVEIMSLYGQVEGKIQQSVETVAEGKNIGKANETTAWEQAISQAEATWTKQLKKGYVKTLEDAQDGKTDDIIKGGVAAMLAYKFSEHGDKIKYKALADPKLDGHRCTSQYDDGVVTLWSRTRKQIKSMPHIVEALEKCGLADRFDGELYNHAYRDNFEELSSFIRQDVPMEGCEVVEYHIRHMFTKSN